MLYLWGLDMVKVVGFGSSLLVLTCDLLKDLD